jgi:HD domain
MPTSATALPQDPGTPSPPTTLRPAGPLLLLLQLALGLAVVFGFTCAVVESVYWWSGPSLRGAQALGESLEQWTGDPEVQQYIERLGAHEIYTYVQLQEAAEALRRVEWARIQFEWLEETLLLLLWTTCVLLGRETWRQYRLSRPAPTIQSPVGILDELGAFVPHALPFPTLDRHPLTKLHPPPEWLRTTEPWTALARALLECYAAHPDWPAAPSVDPSVSGTTLPGHPDGPRLLDHALAVRVRAMALARQGGLPPDLAELVGLGHDLGKLVTFRPDGPRYVRLIPHHDRMSAVLLAALPEWYFLPLKDREDLAMAVAFHHRRDRLPARATPRARALLDVLAEADETIRFQERHLMTGQGVPPPAERAGEPSPAPAPGQEDSPAPAASPTDLQPRLTQILRGLLPALRINTSPFDGRADVSRGFVMLLGSALLVAVTAQLSPAERGALGVPGEGGTDGLPYPTDRLPHPSSAAIAGAFRQLGWLIESWADQSATLWQMKVGRRIWPVCWLLRTDAWPAEQVSRWPAPTWPLEVLGPAEGSTVVDHGSVSASPLPSEPLPADGAADGIRAREEMTHTTPDAR